MSACLRSDFCNSKLYKPRPMAMLNDPNPRNAKVVYLFTFAQTLSGPFLSSISSRRLMINSSPAASWISADTLSVDKGTPVCRIVSLMSSCGTYFHRCSESSPTTSPPCLSWANCASPSERPLVVPDSRGLSFVETPIRQLGSLSRE